MENRDLVPKEHSRNESSLSEGKNHFLGIAINDYIHCSKLNNAVLDVEIFISVLKTHYNFESDNIVFIKDREATKKKIEQSLLKLIRIITPKDNLIIYFSGHGRYDKHFGGNWVPVEAGVSDDDWPDYLSNGQIKDYLSKIKSLHTFLIADSCFSGSLFIDKSKEKFSGDRRDTDPSRWGLTSGKKEIVSDGEPGRHSPFASAILDVLRHTDRPIGVMKICDLVLEKVAANSQQTPMGSPLKVPGHQGGQMVLYIRNNENEDWEKSNTSIEGLREYLRKYPKGKYAHLAESLLNKFLTQKAWEEAKSSGYKFDLLDFEANFPLSEPVVSGELHALISEIEEEELWVEAIKSNTLTSYRMYSIRSLIKKYEKEASEAIKLILEKEKEPAAWQKAKRVNTIVAYEAYIKNFPQGEHVKRAKVAIDNINKKEELISWRNTQELAAIQSYEAYLKIYPTGEFAEKARQLIEAIKKSDEGDFWEKVELAKNIREYEEYLNKYPDGSYAETARTRIKNLAKNKKPSNRGALFNKENKKYIYVFSSVFVFLVLSIMSYENILIFLNKTIFRFPPTSETTTITKDTTKFILSEFVKISNAGKKIGTNMILIKGDVFDMGSDDGGPDEQPIHKVELSSFYINKYEVTFKDFKTFIDSTGYITDAERNKGSYIWNGTEWIKRKDIELNWKYNVDCKLRDITSENEPVIHISWNDAQKYCAWISEQTKLNYRLPSEAEWEFSAGNGKKHTYFSWGNLNPDGMNGGNVADLALSEKSYLWTTFKNYYDGFAFLSPVGSFNANEFGLFDMGGNVSEWCQDWCDQNYYKDSPRGNPQGPKEGKWKIFRGGAWSSGFGYQRVAYRNKGYRPDFSSYSIGFRIARDANDDQQKKSHN